MTVWVLSKATEYWCPDSARSYELFEVLGVYPTRLAAEVAQDQHPDNQDVTYQLDKTTFEVR